MDWEEYENVTKYIYETLGNESGVKIIGHGSNCKVKGKSGVNHQIDVLTSHSDGIHNYKTAIECKYWEQKINKDVVMKLVEIIDDANINKGVIVSKKGFTKDGITYARHKNIGLVELREIEKGDKKRHEIKSNFKVGELSFNTKVELRRPEILTIEFDFYDKNLTSGKINPSLFFLRFKDGNEISLDKFLTSFKEELHVQEPNKSIEKYYEFKDAKIINQVTKKANKIRGFKLKGKLTVKNTISKQQIELVDEVWLIMKSLFENKSFIVSKTGMIKKDE